MEETSAAEMGPRNDGFLWTTLAFSKLDDSYFVVFGECTNDGDV